MSNLEPHLTPEQKEMVRDELTRSRSWSAA